MVALEARKRFVERTGRLGHFGQLFGRQVVNVLVERLAGIDLVLDAVDHRHQHGRERQVRIAARVGAAELDALGLGAGLYIGMRQHAERLRCE